MPDILVPVDFSENSRSAYAYALELADRLKMNVRVLHVFNRSFLPKEPLLFEGDNSLEKVDERRIRDFVRSTPTDPDYPAMEVPAGVEVSYDTVINLSVAGGIRFVADDDEVELIVMGTTNKKGAFVNWMGSTASQISETAPKPVLLIPPGVSFIEYRRIVVASHYETTDSIALDQIRAWAELFKSALHFVHIVFPGDKSPHELIGRATTEQLLTADPPIRVAFEVVNIKGDSVADGLEAYSEEHDADLLMIVNKKRSNWSALMRSSLTQRLALAIKRPLLVMHEEPSFWETSNLS